MDIAVYAEIMYSQAKIGKALTASALVVESHSARTLLGHSNVLTASVWE